MRRVVLVLLVLTIAAPSYAERVKQKSKDKRFEPAVRAAADYAGSYAGPSEAYGLVLEVHRGKVIGNYVELGRVAVLGPVRVEGAELTATASFADGSTRTLRAQFANRILNGRSAFGLRVRDVPVEGFGTVDTFFERLP